MKIHDSPRAMNLFVIKYCLLIGAILTSTALVAGPLNPQKVFSEESATDSGEITADAMYRFGSDVFYKELDKPGNEYMKANMEGYSKELVPTEQQEETFGERWMQATGLAVSGYRACTSAYFRLGSVADGKDDTEKMAVCGEFRQAGNDLRLAEQYFRAAKASSSAGSASGFTIGMTIPRVSAIASGAEAMEASCRRAVFADTGGDRGEYRRSLDESGAIFREMRRQYAELQVLSGDFS